MYTESWRRSTIDTSHRDQPYELVHGFINCLHTSITIVIRLIYIYLVTIIVLNPHMMYIIMILTLCDCKQLHCRVGQLPYSSETFLNLLFSWFSNPPLL